MGIAKALRFRPRILISARVPPENTVLLRLSLSLSLSFLLPSSLVHFSEFHPHHGRTSQRGLHTLGDAAVHITGHHLQRQGLALGHVHHVGEQLDGAGPARAAAAAYGARQDVKGHQLDDRGALALEYEVDVLGDAGSLFGGRDKRRVSRRSAGGFDTRRREIGWRGGGRGEGRGGNTPASG